MNPTLKGVAYVSVWVLLWGTAASVADLVLLKREVYEAGSSGQGMPCVAEAVPAAVRAGRPAGRVLKPGP